MEMKEFKEVVLEEDWKVEMNWKQRSRQLWMKESAAKMKFFHLMTNGKQRVNQTMKV